MLKKISPLGALFILFFSLNVTSQVNDSVFNFVFTSDVHFGLFKENFRGQKKIAALDVNTEQVNVINSLTKTNFPIDNGVSSNTPIRFIDAVIITGDIANRMEPGVQSATQSWKEFEQTYVRGITLLKKKNKNTPLWILPGNHDMSNAIGFHRAMSPLNDPASMLGIYNLMFPQKMPLKYFDRDKICIQYSKEEKGVHFIFLSMYPDSTARVWMENDLKSVKEETPVLIFAHSIPEVEARFFINPNGDHDINDQDKFENLVSEMYKDSDSVKGETLIEQRAFVRFIKKHSNIKAYFHGHENFTDFYNWNGPDHDINLPCFRADSPMKGRLSAKDESKLSFELISLDTKKKLLTAREILWNNNMKNGEIKWGKYITINL